MARGDTYKNTARAKNKNRDTSLLDEMLSNDEIKSEELDIKPKTETKTSKSKKSKQKTNNSPTPIESKEKDIIEAFGSDEMYERKEQQLPIKIKTEKKEESVRRTFLLDGEISQVLDGLVNDKSGKKIKGSKGLLKAIYTNAIIKELVSIGQLDESFLDRIIPYDK